jgi:hypothetical protein
MNKVIMVPIDFKVESLHTLKLALDRFEGQKLQIVLVYAEIPSSSIAELFFYNPYNTLKAQSNKAFTEGITVLKNRYESTISSIVFKVFNGSSASAFEVFADANKIDEIFLSKNYKLQMKNNGFDMTPLIKKSKLSYHEFGEVEMQGLADQLQLNVLFNQ